MNIAKLNVQLTANAGAMTDEFKRAEKTSSTFAQRLKEDFKRNRVEGVNALDRLMRPEQLAKFAIGKAVGSQVAGHLIGAAAEGIESLAKSIEDMAAKASAGTANWRELTMSFVESIPIIGSLFKAGESIGRAILQATDPVATKAQMKEFDRIHAEMKKQGEAFAGIAKSFDDLEFENHLATLDSFDAETARIWSRYEERMEKVKEATKNAVGDREIEKALHMGDIAQAAKDQETAALAAKGAIDAILANNAVIDAEFARLDAIAERVGAELGSLQKTLDQFNMTAAEKAADDIARAGGDSDAQAQASALRMQIDQLDDLRKAQAQFAAEGKSVWETTRTPLEKYVEQLAKLQDLLDSGELEGGLDTYERASQQALDALNAATAKPFKETDLEAPRLLTVGSAGAASFAAKIAAQHGGNDAQQLLVRGQAAGNGLLTQIRDATQGAAGKTAVAQFN